MYFSDKSMVKGDRRSVDLALERLEYCFKHISLKDYQKNGEVQFYHLHMDQYSTFLYYYANSIWKNGGSKIFADKLVLLNRALSGMWCSYKNKLPDIFLLGHPVGTVLGNANYSNYLVVLQNVTVNTIRDVEDKWLLNIGNGAYLSAGAKIIGNSSIGDWCTVGVNTVLHNKLLPDKHLAYNDSDGKLIILKHDNNRIIEDFFIL